VHDLAPDDRRPHTSRVGRGSRSCVGAGIEPPAFAGRVVAAPDTALRLPEIGMGLIPGAGGTVSIPRRIGRRRTLHLTLDGGPLGAADALERGPVDAVGARAGPDVVSRAGRPRPAR
jgi:enoyl-CoA hydratase/carnithine racemase